ncbi:MAG: hemerythrin domain-containing protein, partial [Candidatus Aenigmatarchaeota archaeon]
MTNPTHKDGETISEKNDPALEMLEGRNKDVKIQDVMGTDHDRLDEIFEIFKGMDKTSGEARETFNRLQSGLIRHIEWEEEVLFPIFEWKSAISRGGPTEAMRTEHEQIKDLLERMDERLEEDKGTGDLERKFRRILSDHNS